MAYVAMLGLCWATIFLHHFFWSNWFFGKLYETVRSSRVRVTLLAIRAMQAMPEAVCNSIMISHFCLADRFGEFIGGALIGLSWAQQLIRWGGVPLGHLQQLQQNMYPCFFFAASFQTLPPWYLLNSLWLPHQVYGKLSWRPLRFYMILCWHCVFFASILVPFSGFHFGSTMRWPSKHQIWSVQRWVSKLQGLIWCSSGLAGGSFHDMEG